jgi:glutamate dehydrogenase (NAD(P)+)
LSRPELERVTRRYTSEIGIVIGPDKDIPAPDVGSDQQIMAWMMDTYSVNVGHTASGVVTGKPVALGGSLGRQEATGRGVFIAAREAGVAAGMRHSGRAGGGAGLWQCGQRCGAHICRARRGVVAMQDVGGSFFQPRRH